MPYVYYEELPDGLEEAEAVSREDFESVASEYETLSRQRDELAGTVETLTKDLDKERARYAQLVLDSANRTRRGTESVAATIGGYFG